MSWSAFIMMKDQEAIARLLECCHSRRFAESFGKRRKEFDSPEEMKLAAEGYFLSLLEADWLEAFAAHPKIGDVASLREKFAATKETAACEQSGVSGASEATLQELKKLNEEYEKKFGFIFIVCATGKSADEMLALLKARLPNDRKTELQNAAAEQAKILRLRLDKLL
jgi:2-oxo-4-hydroxy-4-carboxy-5-ureidoimidazoline decarboxylase